jgi:hypothetical protein
MPSAYYERKLPHWQPEDAAVFVTWRLHGTLPRKPDLIGLPAGKAFAAMDRALAGSDGPMWLGDGRVAECVAETLRFAQDELKLYELLAWVIMPNHVHILVQPYADLARITRAVKNYSARRANEILRRVGQPFWQNESYDHWGKECGGSGKDR